MPIKIEDYLADLDGFDLSDHEKRQLIHILVIIMQGFVDCAFGIDPTQLAKACNANADSKDGPLPLDSLKPYFQIANAHGNNYDALTINDNKKEKPHD